MKNLFNKLMQKTHKESATSKKIKSLFITYFDGYYIDATPNIPTTYTMGVCKLEYKDKENKLIVHLRRPELLIGRKGNTIETLQKYLECNIEIIEISILI
jgi:thioredoxin-related protein